MKIKKIIIVVLLFVSNMMYCQTYESWAYVFRFKIEMDKYDRLTYDFFINDSENFMAYQHSDIKSDTLTGSYLLTIKYGATHYMRDHAPDLYIKVNLKKAVHPGVVSMIIPVYFQDPKDWSSGEWKMNANTSESTYFSDLGTFHLAEFTDQLITGERSLSCKIIDVKPGSPSVIKIKDKALLKPMDRLIEVGASRYPKK